MILNIKIFVSYVNYYWLNFKLQTQIIFVTAILALTILLNITSWSTNNIQNLVRINTNWFLNDITNLLENNISSLLKDNRNKAITTFCENIYNNSSSLQYIIFIDTNGVEYGVPYTSTEIFSNYPISQLLQDFTFQPLTLNLLTNIETRTSKIIVLEKNSSGLFLLGSNYNFIYLKNLLITNEIIIFILVLFLTTFFIRIKINESLNKISQGLTSIADGNFSQRINLRFDNDVRSLIIPFNELGKKLQIYKDKNYEQLCNEIVKLESLIAPITDGILLVDTNLQIILVNRATIKIFGWKTKTSLIGTSLWDHLPAVLQKKLFVSLQDILSNNQSIIFDEKFNNDLAPVFKKSLRIFLNLIYNSSRISKFPVGIAITIQDVTKKFELDKIQNRFISNISHELRTPLFNIKSFIETIQEYDYTLSSWQKRYFLNIVNKETKRLTRLLNDILCISKLDSLKYVSVETLNLIEIVKQTISNYQIIAQDKDLYLHSKLSLHPLNVSGNKDLLFQVLLNLVGNALKFTYKKGEILIRVYKLRNNKIRIEIIDTGVGITDNSQQYIFQRFYRVENEVHTLKGTGLGLSIVETILSEHKTKINLVSRYNVGSLFWFDLTAI